MAFHFKKDEKVDRGIQRLLRERLEYAIKRFAECDCPTEPVHAVRKEIKKMRAILWMLRGRIKEKYYRREVEALRQIASLLAPVRDTQVHLQTLKTILTSFDKPPQINPFATLQNLLERERDRTQGTFLSVQGGRKAVELLRVAKERIVDLNSEDSGDHWKALAPGILKTYKRGKHGYYIAHAWGHSEDFHEWRKATKRLWYHMRLVSPAWPGVIGALKDELGRLGERLGADHDLFNLQKIVTEQLASAVPRNEQDKLVTLIAKRQAKLRRESLSLGARIYAEKPTQFCRRIGEYWEAWRKEAK